MDSFLYKRLQGVFVSNAPYLGRCNRYTLHVYTHCKNTLIMSYQNCKDQHIKLLTVPVANVF